MTDPAYVLWIGGSSGSGKSTVARLLARRHGLRWYSCDTRTWDHRDRAIAAGDPAAIAWEQLSPEQRSRLSAAEILRLKIDRSAMVLDDVHALPEEPAVIAEGTPIQPSMVPAGGPAVWLMAGPSVRAGRNLQRGWGVAGSEADLIQDQQLAAELKRTASTMIDTTEHTDVDKTVGMVESIMSDWLADCPRARSLPERRALIREGNAAIVHQYRYGMARAGNTEGGGLVRSYDCECGDPGCTTLVERTLASLPDPFTPDAEPILADGHRIVHQRD